MPICPGPVLILLQGSSQYRSDCPHENISCLSVIGVLFTIVATYSGFILLFIGTMWNANLVAKLRKIKAHWHRLRNGKSINT